MAAMKGFSSITRKYKTTIWICYKDNAFIMHFSIFSSWIYFSARHCHIWLNLIAFTDLQVY